jgi:hypothetical protein
MQDQVVVDLQHDDPHAGDVYILCSDGLSGMMSDEEIQDIVTSSAEIRTACKKLIERANQQGGEDNITAVLIKIEAKEGPFEGSDTERSARIALELAKTADGAPPGTPKAGEVAVGAEAADPAATRELGEAATSPGFDMANLLKKP